MAITENKDENFDLQKMSDAAQDIQSVSKKPKQDIVLVNFFHNLSKLFVQAMRFGNFFEICCHDKQFSNTSLLIWWTRSEFECFFLVSFNAWTTFFQKLNFIYNVFIRFGLYSFYFRELLEKKYTNKNRMYFFSCIKRVLFAQEDGDLPYEEDILKNPTSLRSWQRYIDHKKKSKAPMKQICQVFLCWFVLPTHIFPYTEKLNKILGSLFSTFKSDLKIDQFHEHTFGKFFTESRIYNSLIS